MIKWMEKRLKGFDIWDVALTKWSVAAFVLFLITIWPAAMNLVHSVNPLYFLIATAVFGARPFYRYYLKK